MAWVPTYFGVDAPGALRSALPVFSPKGRVEELLRLGDRLPLPVRDLRRGPALVVGGAHGRLLNDFARSPVTSIAGTRNQWIGGAGLAYTF